MVGEGNVNQKLFEYRLFCPLFFLCRAKCACTDIFIRKRSDLPISGTKQALNYKSRGARPRLIFLSSYQGAFGLIGDFFSKISVLFEVPVFSKVVSITS